MDDNIKFRKISIMGNEDPVWINEDKAESVAKQTSLDRKSTRLNSSHSAKSRMPTSA